MWLCTQHGFYSVVKKDDGFNVRGRVKKDLENLVKLANLDVAVKVYPTADYRYRVIVDAAGLAKIMSALADALDYTNFKSRIGKLPDQRAKEHAYHQIWGIMNRLQEEPPRNR